MSDQQSDVFAYDGGTVEPGETAEFRFPVSETYLGDPVRIPVTIINGPRPGPTVFLSAAVHGDELNGIEVVHEVAQERYLPIYERDLNRAFPGKQGSISSKRIAYRVFHNFVEPCDLGLDFHTSTRGQPTCSTSGRNSDRCKSVPDIPTRACGWTDTQLQRLARTIPRRFSGRIRHDHESVRLERVPVAETHTVGYKRVSSVATGVSTDRG